MSTQRHCSIFKAQDSQWYVTLGDFEHAYEPEDCTTYGPFTDQAAAEKELDSHSNPGSMWTDDSGKAPVPKKVVPPSARRRMSYW